MDRLLEATARAERDHFWFHGFRRFVQPILANAVKNRPNAAILDCGCGTGHNLTMLRTYGHACGIDITWSGLAYARARGERQVARASATSLPFPAGVFDLVTSFDVLYSLERADEQAAVAEMFRLTRPGGCVLINVAAMDVLRGDHSILSHEVRRYTRETLGRLVSSGGFTIERMTYTNATLFLPMAAVRTLHRRRGLSGEADAKQEISVPAGPINAVMSGALFLESAWLRWFDCPFGSSLLCLARKP